MPSQKPKAKSKKRVGLAARAEAARKRLAMSLEELASKTGYSEKTIRNFEKGKATRPKTARDICQALGLGGRSRKGKVVKATDVDHGEYTYDQFKSYLGYFYAYRRSFDIAENLIRTIFEFIWDDANKCLRFHQHHTYYSKRLGRLVKYDQSGEVFMSNSIGLVHLLTKEQGAVRLVTLTKLHHDEHTMAGVVLTQMEQPGNRFQPSASAVYLRKAEGDLAELKRHVGPLEPRDPDHATATDQLRRIQADVANFALIAATSGPSGPSLPSPDLSNDFP